MERARVFDIASDHAHALQADIERTLSATYSLAALVRQGKGSVPDFDATAGEMLPYFPGVSSLQLLPGGVVRRVVPLAGNEGAIGHDLLKDPARNKEAFLARDSGKLTLAGPFNLLQGGVGAVGRLPVFLDTGQGIPSFWGFTAVLIRFPEVLNPARLSGLVKRGYQYELWRMHPDTGERQVIASSSQLPLSNPAEHQMELPNGTWTLSVAPSNGWGDPAGLALKAALGLLFSLLASALARAVIDTNLKAQRMAEELTADLQQSEARYRCFVDTANEGIWALGPDAVTTFVNARMAEMLGYSVEEMNGRPLTDFMFQEDMPDYLNRMENRHQGLSEHYERRYRRKDGQVVWVLVSATPIFDDAHHFAGSFGMLTDITELKEALNKINELNRDLERRVRARTDELRQQTRYLRTLVNTLPVSVWLKDTEGRYLTINSANAAINGHTAEQMIGKTDEELWPGDVGLAFRAGDLMAMSTRQPQTIKTAIPDKDGAIHWREIDKAPVIDEDGTVLGTVGITRDITEQQRLEDAMRVREGEFRALAELSPDTIGRYDRDCRRAYANPALVAGLGYPLEQLLGVTPEETFPGSASSRVYGAAIRDVLADGNERDFMLSWTDAVRGELWSHIRLVPERGRDGEVASVLAIGHDITDLKRYEAAREAALAESVRLAKLRSEFLSHMSHELRTPLNSILGYAQILQMDKALHERHAAALDIMRQSGEHLLALIDDILDLARIETGRLELATVDIALPGLLHGVAEIVGVVARQKQVEFACELAPDLPGVVLGDEKRLRQVLLNLLANAAKFTDCGRIVLKVSRVAPSRLAFAVCDTGTGIAEDELERVFQPFEQGRDAQRRVGGSGLGLSISRQLVRQMGGDIAVESRVGEGSCFRFELDLTEVDSAASLLSAPAPLPAPDLATTTGHAEPLVVRPTGEMRTLHRLALEGDMREIQRLADRVAALDPRYHPFAARLRRLANDRQSKAVLAFVEEYLHDTPD
jgi:PAS domain S-box-containing protein